MTLDAPRRPHLQFLPHQGLGTRIWGNTSIQPVASPFLPSITFCQVFLCGARVPPSFPSPLSPRVRGRGPGAAVSEGKRRVAGLQQREREYTSALLGGWHDARHAGEVAPPLLSLLIQVPVSFGSALIHMLKNNVLPAIWASFCPVELTHTVCPRSYHVDIKGTRMITGSGERSVMHRSLWIAGTIRYFGGNQCWGQVVTSEAQNRIFMNVVIQWSVFWLLLL